MANLYMQIFMNAIAVQVIHYVASVCLNSQYSSLIDSEIERLEWLELTEHDITNVTQKAFVSAEQTCDRIFINSYTPYNQRTLCPWEYVKDYDERRFPPVLYVARCSCRTCSHYGNYQCKPVLYSIPVLIKQCNNGVVQWMRKTHVVSVACTCVRPEIRIVRKRLSRILNIDFDYLDVYS